MLQGTTVLVIQLSGMSGINWVQGGKGRSVYQKKEVYRI